MIELVIVPYLVYVNNRDHKTAIVKTAITKQLCVKIAIIKTASFPIYHTKFSTLKIYV